MDSSDAAGMKKGPWTATEDSILTEYVGKNGEGNWNAVQKKTSLLRCGKSCRLRWANHLRPNLKKGAFSPEEEFLILRLHAQFGNKWARMAALLPGRTDNEIKNYWNTRIKRWKRTGLPLYPPEILRQVSAIRHRTCVSPTTASNGFQDLAETNFLLFSHNSAATGNPIVELPRIKTFREDYQLPVYQHNLFHVPPVSDASTRLLDELLQQRGQKEPSLQETEAGDSYVTWARTGKRALDSVTNSDCSDRSKGIKQIVDLKNQNDMFEDQEMRPATTNPNSGETTSFLPLTPLDRNWHMRSCSWNNMPEIC